MKNQEKWDRYVKINVDPYSKYCVEVARRVMELLDQDKTPLVKNSARNLICQADNDIKAGGIIGFMAGAAASMVVECHERGEEFRKSFNDEFDYDGPGTVNPAIITVP
jgi:hypothetical protein